ncbi:MAG: TlpA family protein disulfide reductase [Thermoleophilaceae bacterium]
MARRWKLLASLAGVAAIVAIVVVGLGDRPERVESRTAGGEGAARPAALPGAGDPNRMLREIAPERFPALLRAARPLPVMVDFWASWCGPCRFEMPFITRLRAKYRERIEFIGVNYQDAPGPAAAFVREFEMNFPSYGDPDGEIGEGQGGIIGMPTAIFFDGRGREVHRQTGAFASEAAMEEVLRRLL